MFRYCPAFRLLVYSVSQAKTLRLMHCIVCISYHIKNDSHRDQRIPMGRVVLRMQSSLLALQTQKKRGWREWKSFSTTSLWTALTGMETVGPRSRDPAF